jgi:hypothetical protein
MTIKRTKTNPQLRVLQYQYFTKKGKADLIIRLTGWVSPYTRYFLIQGNHTDLVLSFGDIETGIIRSNLLTE